MSRPADWSPLAAADPVPGDEVQIRSMSRRYQAFADELEAQAASLNRLATDEHWKACAGQAFASTATELSGQLSKAKGRYRSVSAALSSYANGLAAAQQEADAALSQAKQAEADEKAKNAAAAAAATKPPTAADESDRADAMDQALAGARNRMQQAVEQKEAAGRTAAAQVREAITKDGLRDSWWDKTKNWTSKQWDPFVEWVHSKAPIMKEITKLTGYIATALSVAGMVIAVVPGLNALAPVLFAVAAALTLVSLVCNILMAFSGDASVMDIALDLFGLATFGYGRAAASGIRGAQLGLKAAAKDQVKRQVRKKGLDKPLARQFADMRVSAASVGKPYRLTLKPQGITPRMEKVGGTRVGKFLGMDSEIVMTKAGVNAVRNLSKPTYGPANRAMAALEEVAAKDALVSKVSLGVSLGNLPEVDAFKPAKQATSFGRYATSAS